MLITHQKAECYDFDPGELSMSKGKRPKDYERAGPELGKGRNWYRPEPPTLSKKDIMRKMIQDSKGKR